MSALTLSGNCPDCLRQPWIRWTYGASFDRQTEQYVPVAGLELVESRYVVDDLVKMLTLRGR